MTLYFDQFFSFETVRFYSTLNLIVDGTQGGFLLGESHENDGIPVLAKYDDGYRLIAEVEGLEYVINAKSTETFFEVLNDFNQYNIDKELQLKDIDNFENITILDCRINDKSFKSKFLLIDQKERQFIVNKFSTKKYIRELEVINSVNEW